ncbi:dermonecrotic toxin domain-containing protein, partial [Pseudomonas viridiflava]|uniref:dermonecrotic toxin domain-containing protein n=1 Tax=Pseudomonas viridiflava TaxID=33069 RepID=UPI00311A9D73
EYTLLKGGLPDWLKKASERDLSAFRGLMIRFWQLYTSRQRVVSLASLDQYTVEQVRLRLQKDFPDVQLDPEQILITLTHYTPAPGGTGQIPPSIPAATSRVSESLSDFAINRFSRFQDASLSVSTSSTTSLPDSLDALYVRNLARNLDVGSSYQQYLKGKFSETSPDYLER